MAAMAQGDYKERWARFETALEGERLQKVGENMKAHFGFEDAGTFSDIVNAHINRLFNQRVDTRYLAPELITSHWAKIVRTVEIEMWRAANVQMVHVIQELVDGGTMSDAEGAEFTRTRGKEILDILLTFP